jgi:dolichol-phosphate mannosyltransferase
MPLRIASAFGVVLAGACFLYAATVVTGRLLGFIELPGFATIAALLGFLHGCAFIMMGMLGEYVWRIYTEINQHPEAIAEEITEA